MYETIVSFKGPGGDYGVDINDKKRMDELYSQGYRTDWSGYKPQQNVRYNQDGTRSVVDDYYEGLYQSPEDAQRKTEETKADFARRLQDQVFAIEEAYAPIYQDAYREAQNRLGSTAAINALSGQRGSPSGAANRERTVTYNNQIRQAIDSRKAAEIAAIRGRYDEMLANELKYEETLRRQDADKYIEYLGKKEEKTKEIRKNRLADILGTNVAFDDLDQDLQEDYADLYGYTLGEAKRSWDHKVGVQLEEKERAATEKQREDTRFKWEEEDREKADIAVENELRSRGWEYISDPKHLPTIDKDTYDVVAVKQPGGRPDKLYKVPKGMSELELYEAKKAIDAKYKTDNGEDEGSLTKDEKAFFSDIDAMLDDLSSGKRDWGSAWNYIKSKWAVPDSENPTIDYLLNKDKWFKEGAYEEQLKNRKNIEGDAFLQWLNSKQ